MRKIITIFLLLAMVCSLFGCGNRNSSNTQSTNYTIKDLLFYQATGLAQQVGTAAGSNYMKLLGAPEEVTKLAPTFAAAASMDHLSNGLLLRIDGADLPGLIRNISAQTGNSRKLSCCSMLTYQTQFLCPVPLQQTVAVYLRYGEQCHMVVLFVPQENQLVQATVYPLFAEAAQGLLAKFSANSAKYSSEMIAQCCRRTSAASCIAAPTGNEISAEFYGALAGAVLANVEPASSKEIAPFTSNAEVVTQVSLFTQRMAAGAADTEVFYFPSDLVQSKDEMTRQQLYLSWANQFSGTFGTTCSASNAVLMQILDAQSMGITAQAEEAPVLVAADLGSDTVLISIYPSAFGTYLYRVACLPCPYSQAKELLTNAGAAPMA